MSTMGADTVPHRATGWVSVCLRAVGLSAMSHVNTGFDHCCCGAPECRRAGLKARPPLGFAGLQDRRPCQNQRGTFALSAAASIGGAVPQLLEVTGQS